MLQMRLMGAGFYLIFLNCCTFIPLYVSWVQVESSLLTPVVYWLSGLHSLIFQAACVQKTNLWYLCGSRYSWNWSQTGAVSGYHSSKDPAWCDDPSFILGVWRSIQVMKVTVWLGQYLLPNQCKCSNKEGWLCMPYSDPWAKNNIYFFI